MAIPRIPGGPGLKSDSINDMCGLHANMAESGRLDPSGPSETHILFHAARTCTIQRAMLTLNEAVGTNSKVFYLGKIAADGTETVAYFGTLTATTVTGTDGVMLEFTLSQSAVAQGDTVVVSYPHVEGAGEGWVTVEYTIDDTGY